MWCKTIENEIRIIAFTINVGFIVTIYFDEYLQILTKLIQQETKDHPVLPSPTLFIPSLFLAMRVGSLDRKG